METCGICGKEFTERGMARHMGMHNAVEPSVIDDALRAIWPNGVPVDKIDAASRVRTAIKAALAA